jgi:DNA repair photolyase
MGMNLYRGCAHACAYCDGRAERYRVSGVFGKDVAVKINAVELLERALDPKRKRKPFPGGFVLLGGGVTDSWQPINRKYRLAEMALDVLLAFGRPVHALTKSASVVDSLDRFVAIDDRSRAVISFSFSSVNKTICDWVEPGLSGPSPRLVAMEKISAAGLPTGMFLMPVIPGLTDTEEEMTSSLRAAKASGADFIIFGGMTLKPGRQFDHFIALVSEHHPDLLPGYRKIYPGNRWGSALPAYYAKIGRRLAPIARELNLPLRMPVALWGDLVDETEKVIIILEQLDYLARLETGRSDFGRAARTIANSNRPIHDLLNAPSLIEKLGPFIQELVREIVTTGTSRYYRKLLCDGG